MFAVEGNTPYDHQGLWKVAYFMCKALNKVIDVQKAPCKEAALGSRRHRYIGIGIQGLADAFIKKMFPFESPQAKELSTEIMETIYNGAVEASIDLAEKDGPYETYEGSPASRGLLQFDLWDLAHPNKPKTKHSGRWDWAATKARMAKHGLRNSMLIAPMPTASTSQILGNNECFEPINSNIATRRTLAGDFVCVQKPLMRKLIALGVWSAELKDKIVANSGSVQGIAGIPADIQAVFKTTWEISQKIVIDMAAARGRYVCQSQSLNIFMRDVTPLKLSSMHFYAWRAGLKTGNEGEHVLRALASGLAHFPLPPREHLANSLAPPLTPQLHPASYAYRLLEQP
jgi:ribonucleoside-diphosphate reductase alpha chain